MTLKTLAFGIVALSSLAFGQAARAADGYVGLQLGPSFVNQGIGTRFAIGLHAGEKLTQNFGIGFYYTYENLDSVSVSLDTATASADVNEHIIAFEPNWFPLDSLGGAYLGAKIGMGIMTYSANISASSGGTTIYSGSGSNVNFAAGPAIGYIGSITPNFGLGADFAYIFVTTSGSSLQLANLTFSANFMF